MNYLHRFLLIAKKRSWFAIFLIAQSMTSQNTEISVSQDVQNPKEFFKELEDKSGYSFFYLDDWIENIEVEQNFQDATVSEVLDVVLSDTPFNFYILEEEKRVFLLQNTIIYDELPLVFIKQKTL